MYKSHNRCADDSVAYSIAEITGYSKDLRLRK